MDPNQFKCKDKLTPENQVATTYTLLALSTEVLIEILAYLPAADMITMQRTCRMIRDIIAGTAYLQYLLRAEMNGVEDLLPPNFPYSKRLELLRRHEESWRRSHFDLFAERQRVPRLHHAGPLILQGGYLIYEFLMGRESRWGYTDLCSATQNEELQWVHITVGETRPSFVTMCVFAVDHDLVMVAGFVSFPIPSRVKNLTCHSNQRDNDGTIVIEVAFFEFTTGAPHPLSSTHTLLLQPLSGFSDAFLSAEVLGDHVLVLVRTIGTKAILYLVSWKTGTVTLVSGIAKSCVVSSLTRENL